MLISEASDQELQRELKRRARVKKEKLQLEANESWKDVSIEVIDRIVPGHITICSKDADTYPNECTGCLRCIMLWNSRWAGEKTFKATHYLKLVANVTPVT